jgi:hypothetical protein
MDWFSWTCSSVLHLELLVLVALLIGDEVESPPDVDPIVYDSVVHPSGTYHRPLFRVEEMPDWTGRWPMNCDHQALIRMARKWPSEVLGETICRECGWPWWAIRASLGD